MAKESHVEKEKRIMAFWEKNKIFEKSIEQRPKSKQYVFYDGPPFATGLPHYGNILGLTSKDLFPRFWTMKGYRVERKWGWDCHGLPIENIAEKELGIKEKKEIENDVAKFNEFCRSKVLFFAKEWKKTVTRMGKWIDLDNAYKTMDNAYMETIWWAFKKLYDEKYVYEGKRVLLYCPRCETPLANAEITMDNSYRDVTEKSATAKFKLKGEKDTYLLSWTTTAWTLVGNVALAINSHIDYVKIKVGNEHLILAKNRLSTIKEKYTIIETFKGKKLLHKEYEPLYNIPSDKKGHYVIDGGSEVTEEEGTGIVHMAIYGEFDYEMIKKYDLPIIQHVGHHGKLQLGPKEFENLWFKKADEKVMDDLKERNLLYATESCTHSYPFCYRCDTPLFYNAVDSWFLDIQKIKAQLIKRNKDINWYPDHLKEGRFKHVMESAPDWNISRNRFWATSIPVWKCQDCNANEIIGSVKELQKRATQKVPDDLDLHKHIVDEITMKCAKCKKEMHRTPEVFDCWVESGSMPFAAKHYPFENKPWFENNFPADFISEYIGQVRTWFYYMHVLGTLLFDKAPFKNVVVTGNILAADGKKMSKSKGNFPQPEKIFETYGADALRFYLMSNQLMNAQDLNFHEEEIKEVQKRVIMLLSNVNAFFELFPYEHILLGKTSSKHIMDRWVLSKLNVLVDNVTNALENYNTPEMCREIVSFVEELSRWYVRRSRDRFKSKDKKVAVEAQQTLAQVLITVAKLLAPTMPFLAEVLHDTFKKTNAKLQESVHLEAWPKADKKLISKSLNTNMDVTREIVSKILEQREKAKISVRQPLNKVTVEGEVTLTKEYDSLIMDEVNIKEVQVKKKKGGLTVTLDTKITPELEQEGFSREIMRRIQDLRKRQGLTQHEEISLVIESNYDLKKFKDAIMKKVGAVNLIFGSTKSNFKVKSEEEIKGKKFIIAFNIVSV